jgi:hypothetical protein
MKTSFAFTFREHPNRREHGRGLLLVEAVSKQWGWFPAEPGSPWADGHHGKVVWAVVS